VPPGLLAAAELRAAEIGTGADQVLIAQRLITQEQYARALAFSLGCPFTSLDGIPRQAFPATDRELIAAVNANHLWLHAGTRRFLVVAPADLSARCLVEGLRLHPHLADAVCLTTPRHLFTFVQDRAGAAIRDLAADELRTAYPQFSAGASRPGLSILPMAGAAVATGACLSAPAVTLTLVDIALALVFLGWTLLRALGIATSCLMRPSHAADADDRLPVYSVIVALYREAAAVPGLVQALRSLDYPAEKLDIKLVLEPDDIETQKALSECELAPSFTIMHAPTGGPRTKPKALNAALPFARGAYVVVFDAEDRPEPDQLKRALRIFRDATPNLACVQARLTIDNSTDSWLTRMFTGEYAGLFDVFLPGIAAWRLPLPLGGSSNHFRTSVLREVGAWDSYNVTEDADLGMRLARRGYYTAVSDSTTYEEAPSRFMPWLKQRTRWFKGWMQTWLVHMRAPGRLLQDLGVSGFLVFQLVVGGTVLAALIHGIFAIALTWQVATGFLWSERTGLGDIMQAGLHGTTLVMGYLISGLLALLGLIRRRALACAWALFLIPLYWLLLSIAAWRALLHLAFKPYTWEKTAHGLARTSRRSGVQRQE
jgi:cellulose synthase/poly-beta-1,6-N-acetylglucosamine synthase-like glycosyltransferase